MGSENMAIGVTIPVEPIGLRGVSFLKLFNFTIHRISNLRYLQATLDPASARQPDEHGGVSTTKRHQRKIRMNEHQNKSRKLATLVPTIQASCIMLARATGPAASLARPRKDHVPELPAQGVEEGNTKTDRRQRESFSTQRLHQQQGKRMIHAEEMPLPEVGRCLWRNGPTGIAGAG